MSSDHRPDYDCAALYSSNLCHFWRLGVCEHWLDSLYAVRKDNYFGGSGSPTETTCASTVSIGGTILDLATNWGATIVMQVFATSSHH